MDRVEIISERGSGTSITMIKNLSTTHEVWAKNQ
jgi:serine/threonine-protein kinase RsbW